jgi:hypothetical protein
MDQFEMMEKAQQQQAEREKNATPQQAGAPKVDGVNNEVLPEGNPDGENGQIGSEGGNLTDDNQNPELENGDGGEAVVIPDDLKEWESVLESRGWKEYLKDPAKGFKEVLKSYAEADKLLGQKGNINGTLTKRLEEVEGALTGDPEQINNVRKQFGLEPIQILDHEAKAAEVGELFDMFRQIYSAASSGKPDAALEQKLIEKIESIKQEAMVQGRLKSERSGRNPDLKKVAVQNIQALAEKTGEKYDDILKRFDLIHDDPDIDNLFRGISGNSMISLVTSPERTSGLNKLMKYLEKGMKFEATVKAEVEKRIGQMQARTRNAQNAGGNLGGAGAPPRKQVNEDAKAIHGIGRLFV